MNEENKVEPTQINPRHTLDPKVAAVLSYFFWLVGGIVFYATSRDPFVRFHAMQSILFNAFVAAVYVLIMFLGFLLWFLLGVFSIIAWMVIFAIWLLLMLKAYQGEKFKLPILGDLAEKLIRG